MKPGIHAIPPAEYHQDPTEQPSLSAHIAHVLLTRSPLHAWTNHPKLNPAYEREEKASFDFGTAVHDLFLRGTLDHLAVGPFNDWRTKEAKAHRDAAYEAGLTPILAKDLERVQEMVDSITGQLAEREDDPPLFAQAGKPEQALVWQERGVTCRALVDWLHDDMSACDDLKSTMLSANPWTWTRTTMWNIGADIQACFYMRGVEALTGRKPLFRFCVVESRPPFAMSVVSLSPAAEALANSKIDAALETWKRCLETDVWPAYTREVCYAEPPAWSESQWLEQQAIEEAA